MYCPKCGTENKAEGRFCKKCGTALEVVEKDVETVEVKNNFCPKCGSEFKDGGKFCGSCGANIRGSRMVKADPGMRLVAYIIDMIILIPIGIILGLIVPFFGTLASVGYYTYFFGNGQTLGMKAVNIKLCGTDGTYPVGYGRGFLRLIGMMISGIVFGLGYIWILIDEDYQGWHDKIAGTYVVKE